MSLHDQQSIVVHVVSAATDYAVPYAYWSEQDLEVWFSSEEDDRRLLALGSDYDLVTPMLSHEGGVVRLRAPLAAGLLILRRETRIIQGFSAPPNARGFEHALDRLAMVLQEQRRNLAEEAAAIRAELATAAASLRAEMQALFSRTLRTPEPIPELPPAADRVSKSLTFDAAGRPRLVDFYAVNPFLPICDAPRWTPEASICDAPIWTPDAAICAAPAVMIGGCAPCSTGEISS